MGKMYHENTKQDEDGADIWVSEKDLRAMEVSRRWEIAHEDRLILNVFVPGDSCRPHGARWQVGGGQVQL